MIVKSHCPENRRTPKAADPWSVVVGRIAFVVGVWALLFFVAYHVSGAVRTPGNPFQQMMEGK